MLIYPSAGIPASCLRKAIRQYYQPAHIAPAKPRTNGYHICSNRSSDEINALRVYFGRAMDGKVLLISSAWTPLKDFFTPEADIHDSASRFRIC
jgi:hypothetical protein